MNAGGWRTLCGEREWKVEKGYFVREGVERTDMQIGGCSPTHDCQVRTKWCMFFVCVCLKMSVSLKRIHTKVVYAIHPFNTNVIQLLESLTKNRNGIISLIYKHFLQPYVIYLKLIV